MSLKRGTGLMLALAAFTLLHQMCQGQKITNDPPPTTVVVKGENSSSVLLRWEYNLEGFPRLSVTFTKRAVGEQQPKEIFRKGENQSPVIDDAYEGRLEMIQEAGALTLKIRDVKDDEDGLSFACQIVVDKNGATIVNGGITKLEILHVPKITRYDLRKTATLNRNVTLSCNASGDPEPVIQWMKVGDENRNFSRGYKIHLINVKTQDIGAYRCIASNGLGKTANATTMVEINCGNDCQIHEDVVITTKLPWKTEYTNSENAQYKELTSFLLGEIWGVYTGSSQGRNKELRKASVKDLREGSVIATLQLEFKKSVSDPLQPLKDAVNSGKLGTIPVERDMIVKTTPASTTMATTEDPKDTEDPAASSSGLSEEAKWGIIGACIAVALIVIIVLIICCCCRQKKKQRKGPQYETDSSFATKRSGLGGASPAYAQASAYRQPAYNPSSQEPPRDGTLNYSQVSYTNSQPQNTSPPPYDNTSGQGNQDKGKEGFELWC